MSSPYSPRKVKKEEKEKQKKNKDEWGEIRKKRREKFLFEPTCQKSQF